MNTFRASVFVLVVSLAVALTATTALAGGAPRTHDGFFLRLSGGFGYAGSSTDVGASELEVSGATGDVNFAIGGMVSPNLALHGTLMGVSATNPDMDWGGAMSEEFDGEATLTAIGPGLTYYFMPANVYISGSVGLGRLEADIDGGPTLESDTGFVLDAGLGKEWWVGNSWGLGVAGGVMFHSIPVSDTDESWTGVSLGLRFSATYN